MGVYQVYSIRGSSDTLILIWGVRLTLSTITHTYMRLSCNPWEAQCWWPLLLQLCMELLTQGITTISDMP